MSRRSIPDADYQAAGARIGDAAEALGADIVLKVRGTGRRRAAAAQARRDADRPARSVRHRRRSALVRAAGVTGFALERLPRISRAQSMDVLSSQANIAGYKAVIIAAERIRPVHADADDGGRHGQGRARAGDRRRRRRLAGDRHGEAPRRGDRGLRRAARRSRTRSSRSARSGSTCRTPTTRSAQIAEGVGGYARPMPPRMDGAAGGASSPSAASRWTSSSRPR